MGSLILQAENLKQFPFITHGFTTRHSSEMLADVFTLKQIHSGSVYWYGALKPVEGDAIITQTPKVRIGVRTADCVPLLIYDPGRRVIAVIHAGWRGLIAGIIENTLSEMKGRCGTNPKDLVVAIGAALCEKCFEVGPEVAEQFSKKFGSGFQILKGQGDRSYLDLREGCREILEGKGVSERNIETLPYCTSCNRDLFYSYRKGDKEGRMTAFIGLLD